MTQSRTDLRAPDGAISSSAVAIAALLGWGLVLGVLVGGNGWPGALLALLTNGPTAIAIFLSAAGWGSLLVRPLMRGRDESALEALTSTGAGLWLLSTALLIAGSLWHGMLSLYLWWPIIAAGIALAIRAWASRLRHLHVKAKLPPASALWVLAGIAAGIWIAGATLPPGVVGVGNGDFYDELSYHLQVPREFYDAGHIGFLQHNTYSNYPLGAEMLFLLGMVLHGGAYEGVYVAKLTHGLWGVLAVLTLLAGLPRESAWRRRTAGVLLATMPWTIYLSWLAFVELSEIFYLSLALVWLWRWLEKPAWRSAALVGLACGGACATKYLSVGLIAAPVLAVMALSGVPLLRGLVRKGDGESAAGRRWAGAIIAGGIALAMLSPWLVRNTINTGNPVFPLATKLLGQGHWSNETVERWNAGHAPPKWEARPRHLLEGLIGTPDDQRSFGILLLLLTGAAALWVILRGRKSESLDRTSLAILLMQMGVWATATHMPGRFLVPASVPMVVLAGGFVAWLHGLRLTPPASKAGAPQVPRGSALSAMLVAGAAGLNLLLAGYLYRAEPLVHDTRTGSPIGLNGMTPQEVATLPGYREIYQNLGPTGKLLLVGDVRPFNLPANTLYASVWEEDPLLQIVRQTHDPHEIIRRLRGLGVTHIWINWREVARLRRTYGWWSEINEALIDSLLSAGARDVNVLGANPLPEERMKDGRPYIQMISIAGTAATEASQ